MGYQSGGHSRTGTTAHRRWRRAVLHRDGYRCQQCGYQGSATAKPADVEADHILNVKRGGDDSIDNGQTLCVPCHEVKTKTEAAEGRRRRSRRRPERRHPGLI